MKRFFQKKFQITHQRGFTLIELLVSLSLFAIAMLMATTSTLIVLDANAKSQSTQNIMTNLNMILDAMSRDLRTGTRFARGTCASPGGSDPSTAINFHTQDDVWVEYALSGTTITKLDCDNSTVPIQLTADGIKVTKLLFYGSGLDPFVVGPPSSGDLYQPIFRIVVQGEAGIKAKQKATFSIQTSVAQRAQDVQ